jgi:hypothetical protein
LGLILKFSDLFFSSEATTMTRTRTVSGLGALALTGSVLGQGDPAVIARIVEEGKQNNQVWEHLEHLSHVIGHRLTGSSNLMEANAWTRDRFVDMGLQNVRLHRWGEIPVRFDRGPSSARMLEPAELDFEFTTRAWSAGTNGPVRGHVIKEPRSMEELDAVRDRLEGAWILSKGRAGGRRRGVVPEGTEPQLLESIRDEIRASGIAGQIISSASDLVRTGAGRGWRELTMDTLPTDVSITVRRSDYDAMNSRLADGEEIVVEVDLVHHFAEGPFPLFNTIAEIPGTELPHEAVIVSAHLDSWDGPGSQGAQDNGTGSSVTLEAARILMAAGAKPKRTIRFILWTGEEQGLLGSRGYVQSLSEEEAAGISAVFVDDGGTNYEGGLVCIEPMAPILTAATTPVNEAFPDMPVEIRVRENMPRGGGSDHVPFNRVGIPGFFWVESGIGGREGKNYRYIHHTQHDTTRYALEEYLVQSSTCAAITAYNVANAATLLPRVDSTGNAAPTPTAAPVDTAPFNVVTGPASGTWKAVLVGENAPPDSEFTISIETSDDGRIRGKVDSQIGNETFSDGKFDAATNKLTFGYNSEMMGRLKWEATIDGDKISGTINIEEQFSMPFKGERQAAEPAAKEGGDIAKSETPPASEAGGDSGSSSDGGN